MQFYRANPSLSQLSIASQSATFSLSLARPQFKYHFGQLIRSLESIRPLQTGLTDVRKLSVIILEFIWLNFSLRPNMQSPTTGAQRTEKYVCTAKKGQLRSQCYSFLPCGNPVTAKLNIAPDTDWK
jgi:hypothetical protein